MVPMLHTFDVTKGRNVMLEDVEGRLVSSLDSGHLLRLLLPLVILRGIYQGLDCEGKSLWHGLLR